MVLVTQFSNKFGYISSATQFAFSLFSGNWYITFNEWLPSYPINPLWSISVEEQLYILLPLVVLYTGKRGLKIFSFLALLIAYVTVIYYAQKPTKGFSGEWTNSFVHFQFFAAGILFSVHLKGWQPKWRLVPRIVLFVAGVVCWLLASIICEIHADAPHLSTIPQAVGGWLLILAGVVLFFLALYGASLKYMPFALVYLGRISYGMYIFHITIFWLVYQIFKDELASFSTIIGLYEWKNNVGFIIAFLATIIVSLLSYRFFERPFLQLKRKFTLIPFC